jgi:hypothetical protein
MSPFCIVVTVDIIMNVYLLLLIIYTIDKMIYIRGGSRIWD